MSFDVNKYLIGKNATIQNALNALIKCGSKCLVVADKEINLIGTLSDGDLRKSILKGKKLTDKISNVFNKKPKFLYDIQNSKQNAQNIFLTHLVDIIPVINKNKKIIKILKMDDVFRKKSKTKVKKNSIPIVIMAGGKGTRLEPFTSVLPKPLIPINGKPIINHIIDRFGEHGFFEYYVSINYKSRILKAFFEESKKSNNIHFIEEKKPLGTVGALSKIKKYVKSHFFVTNCDIIIDCDYNDIIKNHKESKNLVTVVASFRNYTIPYGDCKISDDGLLDKIDEKPNINLLANTGMYIMNKEVINYIPNNQKLDLPQLIQKLRQKNKKIGVFPVSEKAWIDVGQWNEYKKAINNLEMIK